MLAKISFKAPKRIHTTAGAISQETIPFLPNKMRVSKMTEWFQATNYFNSAFLSE